MSRARLLFVLALAAFLGWLGWLGYAVVNARYVPDKTVILSRAQLTAATHLIVAQVELSPDGLPAEQVTVVEVVKGSGIESGDTVEVSKLKAAKPPGPGGFPGPGRYLVPVVRQGETGPFDVAELPRSPGYEPSEINRPPIYQWNDETRSQLRGLGIVP